MDYGIHWFRRDLRVAGNTALQHQFKKYDGKVVGIFCFDKKFLSRKDMSFNRFQFFLESMAELKKELKQIGSDLLVLDIGPEEAFEELFTQLKDNNIDLPKTITWSRDYEPFALARDKKMKKFFESYDIETHNFRDHLIIEPHELSKQTGGPYQVYTPFSRRWLEIYNQEEIYHRVKIQKNGIQYINKLKKGEVDKVFKLTWKKVFNKKVKMKDHLDDYIESNKKKVTIPIPKSGTLEAFKYLDEFKKKMADYGEDRDIPSIKGTSKMSLFLKNGSITTAQIIYYLKLTDGKYLKELIWREFYYHIMTHFPYVEKSAFQEKYKDLAWDNNKKLFEVWKEGKTGFPIVDAGMRELNETGWMHNRVRMIVASFLTKDLRIDWRWGEQYFMEKLLDGDLAPNNGGWQWAASTGCDAQPYFRIFNPWSQSKRFDPEAIYIKKYIPELSDLTPKQIHNPIEDHEIYPAPIVDHKIEREKTLAMYKSI